MSKDIAITITPLWAIIEHVRRRIKTDLGPAVDRSKVDAAIICASELCENAIKYGDSVEHMQFIQFNLKYQESSIAIVVANGVTNPQDLRNARTTIDRINREGNPEQLYINRLKELITSSRPEKSQLGLFRIAHETGFALSYTHTEDSITITARLNLP